MDWQKLIEELGKKEFSFLATKAKNKFFKSTLSPIQISNSLNPVFVFSSTRSGSTWLLELLLKNAKYRAIFEPLPKLEDCLRSRNTPRVILSKDSDDEWLNSYMTTLMTPNELNKRCWKNSTINSRNIHFLARGLAIKSTRANFCIDFIYKNAMDARIKILYLIRNPFAVIKSKIVKSSADKGQLAKKFSYDPADLFRTTDSFFNEYFGSYESIYSRVDNKVKLEAFTWCIENKWILDTVKQRPWNMVVYENLFVNFRHEFAIICDYVGIPFKTNVERTRSSKSSTAFSGDKRRFIDSIIFDNVEGFLNDWKSFFTRQEIRDITDIVNRFQIDYNALIASEINTFLQLPL